MLVLCTGFGPFGSIKTNPSWQAVKLLAERKVADVTLKIEEIPVDYAAAPKLVQSLWDKFQPDLCIHIGVAACYDFIALEQFGNNEGYTNPDICGRYPDQFCCVPGGEARLRSDLDMKKICSDVKKTGIKMEVKVSNDAGSYLCDFVYYTSLHMKKNPTIFIHVPNVTSEKEMETLVDSLVCIITAIKGQIDSKK
ncbi:pyroglutamyl-peptidase 1-like [Oscarella lobularis]|uniref:pyroglutamyl-peptidase 1-like n=1 Tax=Oscarella lobularis TaxID=121494 RepID=UPI003313F9C5